jgi:SAM-dependent methyltransferase
MQPEVYREMAAVQATHWWFAGRRCNLAAVIERLGLPPSAQVLEIGCGTGANLGLLARFGRLSAMELDGAALAVARDVAQSTAAAAGCELRAGALPEPVPFDDGRFDLVCMLDVLEHIADDGAALARAARLLAPGGRLLVTVPAYRWLWSGHDTAHHHHRRYTAGGLAALAQRVGLNVLRLGYFNTVLLAPIALARLLQRLPGRDGGSDAEMPWPPVNRLLRALFAAERHVLARCFFPFGVSVLAVIERAPASALAPGGPR